MTARCLTCRGPLYGCDVLTKSTTCVECERRQLDRLIAAAQPSEWDIFVAAIRQAAVNGIVHANDVRPLLRGRVYHKRIGQFWRRAKADGLLVELRREESQDRAGKNTHHTAGVYEMRVA